MKYSFKKHDSFNARNANKTVAITGNRTISLASAFIEANGLESYRHAVLYFDRATKSIGIKFTKNNTETSKFALSRAPTGKGASISAHSFFTKNDEVTKYANNKYYPQKLLLRDLGIEETGYMFVIDLDKPIKKEPKLDED